jgi:hypothetical protein
VAGAVATPIVDDQEAAPAGGWDAFEKRLNGAITKAARDSRNDSSRRGGGGSMRIWWGGALAASILLACGAFFVGRHAAPSSGTSPQVAETPANRPALAASDVTRQVRAFREINQVFDGRARWVVLSEGDSDVGLIHSSENPASRPGVAEPAGGSRKLLLVRLSLKQGTSVVSDVDVVVVPGTTAIVNLPTSAGQTLRYRLDTSAADPMQMTVRMEVPQDANTGAAAVLGTTLRLQPFQDAIAGQVMTPHGAFELNVAAASAANEGKL